jgi:hypothetical protein
VDVFDKEEGENVENVDIKQAKKEEQFEVRLIIWETRDVVPSGATMNA